MFTAFTMITHHEGAKAVITEVGGKTEFEGFTLVKPVGSDVPRPLHSFERLFNTHSEATAWAAGEIELFASGCLEKARAIRNAGVADKGVSII